MESNMMMERIMRRNIRRMLAKKTIFAPVVILI